MAALAAGVGLARWAGDRLLPASPLPPPTGPHPVGTTVVQVEGPRLLPVQLWYPAAQTGGTPAPLFPSEQVADVVGGHYGVPSRLLRGLGRPTGHAVAGAPARLVRGIAVVSHGWMGFRTIHADLAEHLASEGWLVAAPDHVGGALVSQHLDGTAVGLEQALMPPADAPDYGPRVSRLVGRYAADVGAVLDGLASGADVTVDGLVVPPVSDVLLIGHSTGGGAAVLTAHRDPRVGSVLGLDPWVEPVWPAEKRIIDQPFIAIRSGGWVGNGNDGHLTALPGVELRSVPEAGHIDLTGLAYLSPLIRRSPLSQCDPALAHDASVAALADLAAQLTTPSPSVDTR